MFYEYLLWTIVLKNLSQN